ncbi:MAG: leucine-rich repeat domain-containing protein [Planctomycetia bacterium]|nr:leucine-rich repeat domain-containing protein [Planctomycetia bacterium]
MSETPPIFEYEIHDGQVTITRCMDYESDLIIPREIKGFPVTEIAKSAVTSFDVSTVTVPETILKIGNNAFGNCYYLTAVHVSPQNPNYAARDGILFSKDYSVLYSCPRTFQGDYVIPETVRKIDSWAFFDCQKLQSVIIPEGVTHLPDAVFYSCENLTSVRLPTTLQRIGKYVFRDCEAIQSITIPEKVKSISQRAFWECDSLQAIHVSPKNRYYKSVDGVLFNRDGTILQTYPAGRPNPTYAVPVGTEKIQNFAFEWSQNLTSVTIPDTVREIGYKAFEDCSALTSVRLPATITEIKSFTFNSCNQLTSITIPPSVTKIKTDAFRLCRNLTSVTVSTRDIKIHRYAFYACSEELTIKTRTKKQKNKNKKQAFVERD